MPWSVSATTRTTRRQLIWLRYAPGDEQVWEFTNQEFHAAPGHTVSLVARPRNAGVLGILWGLSAAWDVMSAGVVVPAGVVTSSPLTVGWILTIAIVSAVVAFVSCIVIQAVIVMLRNMAFRLRYQRGIRAALQSFTSQLQPRSAG